LAIAMFVATSPIMACVDGSLTQHHGKVGCFAPKDRSGGGELKPHFNDPGRLARSSVHHLATVAV